MARPVKIGQYRHTPGDEMRLGTDGVSRHTQVRRRFPYTAVVVLAYGIFGPLLCAAVTWAIRASGGAHLLPTYASGKALPPSPGLGNVLFGAGATELALAWAIVGYWIWRSLWRQRLRPDIEERGPAATIPEMIGAGLLLGVVGLFLIYLFGMYGLYVRAGPADQPVFVRPFFGILAAPVTAMSAILTGTVPIVLLALGLLTGLLSAAAVGLCRPHFPEEPILR